MVDQGAIPALLACSRAGDNEVLQWTVWASAALAQDGVFPVVLSGLCVANTDSCLCGAAQTTHARGL